MEVEGRAALVTGASGGLGGAIARTLASAGVRVAAGFHEGRERVDVLCADIRAAGGTAEPVRLDQASAESAAEAVAETVAAFGGLDIVVNNAAMAKGVPFPDLDALDDALWDLTMQVNLRGPWLVSRAAAPHLKASGRGRIVNIAAMAGLRPMGASIVQSVSKAGVIQLTRCLAVALAPDVTVNCVAPGLMEGTELTRNISDAFRDSFKGRSALGTTTSLDDVAAQVLQFCRADTVTGQTLVIDGGVHFH